MKRFTETDKWKDVWFRELTAPQKLLFIYVIENCNNAGFYEEDMEMMKLQIGMASNHIEGAYKGLTRGLIRASGWCWVKNFLKHQKNDELNESNPAHRQIIRLLAEQVDRFSECSEFQTFLAPYKGLLRPIGNSKGKGKEESVRETKRRGSRDELIEFCVGLSLPESDGEWLFDKWEGNGWKNDGKAILDWRATARTWKRTGTIFPSQKAGTNGHKPSKMFLTE